MSLAVLPGGRRERKSSPVLASTRVYDPKTDTWSQRKPMPETRVFDTAACAANGKIHVIGGTSFGGIPGQEDAQLVSPPETSTRPGEGPRHSRGAERAQNEYGSRSWPILADPPKLVRLEMDAHAANALRGGRPPANATVSTGSGSLLCASAEADGTYGIPTRTGDL